MANRLSLSDATRKSGNAGKRNEDSKDKQTTSQAKVSEVTSSDITVDDNDSALDGLNIQKGSSKALFVVVGAVVVVVVVLLFLLFAPGKSESPDTQIELPDSSAQQPNDPELNQGTDEDTEALTQDSGETVDESLSDDSLGTQNFLENTTMQTSDVLTDPNMYIEDLYGLTTRVDYVVEKISNVADFVSYEKHRGTWGGGLELYWLDAEYKGQHYVVQVPFEYYKELDDVGIVPVKMEVLTIKGSAEGEKLNVISYMCLDAEVLEDILKQQVKS